jgi:hypothetical protein
MWMFQERGHESEYCCSNRKRSQGVAASKHNLRIQLQGSNQNLHDTKKETKKA